MRSSRTVSCCAVAAGAAEARADTMRRDAASGAGEGRTSAASTVSAVDADGLCGDGCGGADASGGDVATAAAALDGDGSVEAGAGSCRGVNVAAAVVVVGDAVAAAVGDADGRNGMDAAAVAAIHWSCAACDGWAAWVVGSIWSALTNRRRSMAAAADGCRCCCGMAERRRWMANSADRLRRSSHL